MSICAKIAIIYFFPLHAKSPLFCSDFGKMGEGGRAGETWRDTIRTVCTYWTWRSVYKICCYSTKLPCLLKLHFFHVYQEDVCKRKLEFNPFFRQDVGSKNKQDIFPLFSEERRTRDAGKKYIFLNDHWPPLEILDIFLHLDVKSAEKCFSLRDIGRRKSIYVNCDQFCTQSFSSKISGIFYIWRTLPIDTNFYI